jgi:hypothetical protein
MLHRLTNYRKQRKLEEVLVVAFNGLKCHDTIPFFVAKVVNSSRKGLGRTLEPSETALLRLEGGDGNIFSWILPPHLFLSWELLSFPEMEFLEINLTKDSSLFALHAIHSLSNGRFFCRKPDSTVL